MHAVQNKMAITHYHCAGVIAMKKSHWANITGRQIHSYRVKRKISPGDMCRELRARGIQMSCVKLLLIELRLVRIFDMELFRISQVLGVPAEALFPQAASESGTGSFQHV